MALGTKRKSEQEMNNLLRAEDFHTNRAERLPVVLCLDCSPSMFGEAIEELNRGVKMFYDACKAHDRASLSVEVAVVAFGGEARVAADFCGIKNATPPVLSANMSYTNFAAGAKLSLEKIEEILETYKDAGLKRYHPWFVFMSDGEHNFAEDYKPYAKQIREMQAQKKLVGFSIAIGEDADVNALREFSDEKGVLRLNGLQFEEFFKWLSASIAITSASKPGDKIDLPMPGAADTEEEDEMPPAESWGTVISKKGDEKQAVKSWTSATC